MLLMFCLYNDAMFIMLMAVQRVAQPCIHSDVMLITFCLHSDAMFIMFMAVQRVVQPRAVFIYTVTQCS